MKKIIGLFLLIAMTAILLASCGNMKTSDSMGAQSVEHNQKTAMPEDGALNTEALAENKKIIKNAMLDVEAPSAKDTYAKILDWAKQNGGYEFSQSLNARGEYTVINAKIKIAPQKLDAFIAFIGECSDVINCNISSEDITDMYFDTDVRLKSIRASLDSYYKLLAEAKNVEEILQIQKTIDEITAQIEAMQGRLNFWDRQVDESTVTINIREKNDPIKVSKQINWSALSFSDMGRVMQNGFLSVWNFIITALQWILIVIVSILPLIIIAGIVLWVIWFIRKRRK